MRSPLLGRRAKRLDDLPHVVAALHMGMRVGSVCEREGFDIRGLISPFSNNGQRLRSTAFAMAASVGCSRSERRPGVVEPLGHNGWYKEVHLSTFLHGDLH